MILPIAIIGSLLVGAGLGYAFARATGRQPEQQPEQQQAPAPAVVPKPQPSDVGALQRFVQQLQESYKRSPNDRLKAKIVEAKAALKLARLARRTVGGGHE
jgi:hypothetical protein